MPTLQDSLAYARDLLQASQRIVALTGAGISTESGIPDFRSPGSIWQRQKPVSQGEFLRSAEARQAYWQTRRSLSRQISEARPNAAHYALVQLEQKQRLLSITTQNFDGLHQDAGNTPQRVLELHGTSRQAACTLCSARSSIADLEARIEQGEIDPQCAKCGGYLKAATILFGQRVPESVLAQARQMTNEADLFLVLGSSLSVLPAAYLPRQAIRNETPLIILNLTATSLDQEADVAIHARIGQVLPALLTTLP